MKHYVKPLYLASVSKMQQQPVTVACTLREKTTLTSLTMT